MHRLAIEEVERINEDNKDLLARITNTPEGTLDIVHHIRFLDNVDSEVEKLFLDVDYAHNVFIIIKDFAIPIDDERKEDYMDCEDNVNRTHDILKQIQSTRPEFVKLLAAAMDEDIETMSSDTHELYLAIQNPRLLEVSVNRFVNKWHYYYQYYYYYYYCRKVRRVKRCRMNWTRF